MSPIAVSLLVFIIALCLCLCPHLDRLYRLYLPRGDHVAYHRGLRKTHQQKFLQVKTTKGEFCSSPSPGLLSHPPQSNRHHRDSAVPDARYEAQLPNTAPPHLFQLQASSSATRMASAHIDEMLELLRSSRHVCCSSSSSRGYAPQPKAIDVSCACNETQEDHYSRFSTPPLTHSNPRKPTPSP